ncbi:hypothetical protein GGX14DRAFT_568681 [Mycena pura]|uniref:Uncharacterized protein n=1 Tax=Mycena pura TaxID=153505 RepID=A0AAD6V8K4_9AGAR|nr:hypothetical protein GGX14DRAFT_568681 [Mycena pura]
MSRQNVTDPAVVTPVTGRVFFPSSIPPPAPIPIPAPRAIKLIPSKQPASNLTAHDVEALPLLSGPASAMALDAARRLRRLSRTLNTHLRATPFPGCTSSYPPRTLPQTTRLKCGMPSGLARAVWKASRIACARCCAPPRTAALADVWRTSSPAQAARLCPPLSCTFPPPRPRGLPLFRTLDVWRTSSPAQAARLRPPLSCTFLPPRLRGLPLFRTLGAHGLPLLRMFGAHIPRAPSPAACPAALEANL